MRTIENLVFWQGAFSIHQSALLRNVAASCGVNVTLVVWQELMARSLEKGWSRPDYGRTRIILRPTQEAQSELLSADPSTTVHIFPGTRGHSITWNALCQCLSSEGYIGIQSEAYRRSGIKGFLRLLRGKYDALRLRERINLVLGIGSMSVDWYERCGYPNERIFPFAYFVEAPSFHISQPTGEELSNQCFDLVFVGHDLFRKGLDILLRALHGIGNPNWQLHIVDNQDKRKGFAELSAELGLSDSVHFYGALPNPGVIDLISKCDLLVLPSRWDGWGAVVNEALMCGVPVVCSDRCGAADLLDGGERGEVVTSGDIMALHSVLARRISQGKKDVVTSRRIREWSKCIDGKAAADYLMAIVDAAVSGGSRPCPPWLQQDQARCEGSGALGHNIGHERAAT